MEVLDSQHLSFEGDFRNKGDNYNHEKEYAKLMIPWDNLIPEVETL